MGRHLSSQEVMYDVIENPLYGGATVRATFDVENTSVRHLRSAKNTSDPFETQRRRIEQILEEVARARNFLNNGALTMEFEEIEKHV